MEQWTPDAWLLRLKKISRQQWWAFAGAWLAGLCAHGYMFANKLSNHDDIASMWDTGASYTSGRWGLYLVSKLDGGLSTPWILGLLSLLFLGLAAMLAGYIGLTRYILPRFGIALVSYQGLDQMGRIDLALLPHQILESYRVFFGVYGSMTGGISTTPAIRFALTACQWLAILLIGIGAGLQRAAGRWQQAGLAALTGLLMPMGINVVYLMNAGQVHSLMLYPMCMIPLVFLSRFDGWHTAPAPQKPAGQRVRLAARWVSVCLAAMLLGRYVLLDNEAYLQMQLNHSRRVAYWTGIVASIKTTPGYDSSLPLVIINESCWDPTVPIWWPTNNLDDMMGVRMGIHYGVDAQFMDQFIGFAPALLPPEDYAALPEVQQMPVYPTDGSIRIVEKDGEPAVVIKF